MAPRGLPLPLGKEAAFVAFSHVMSELREERDKLEMRSCLKLVGGEFFANDDLSRQIADAAATPGDDGHGDRLRKVRLMLLYGKLL